MPDLILLSALLSPRDEDALIAHLRSLDGASHLQTITIPQFRTGPAQAPEKKGGLFSKKSKAPAPTGADPMAFAEEVVAHLKEACEIRNRPQTPKPAINVIAPFAPPPCHRGCASAPQRRSIPHRSSRNTWHPSLEQSHSGAGTGGICGRARCDHSGRTRTEPWTGTGTGTELEPAAPYREEVKRPCPRGSAIDRDR